MAAVSVDGHAAENVKSDATPVRGPNSELPPTARERPNFRSGAGVSSFHGSSGRVRKHASKASVPGDSFSGTFFLRKKKTVASAG